ncbi:unnamed protein product [Linum trigynum]|uniref:CCHC-type domain-containing protein n=1 Tax=Linum trigynum TaxID=586398 RepID=A0AAV2DPJ4_9ROSI
MEKQRYRRKWRSALIVKVLGRTFPFPVISRRLETLWAKDGSLQISSLSYGYYVVRFTHQMDFEQARLGGPWLIGEHYITVRPWRKNFDSKMAKVASTLVWVRLPELPVEFVNQEAVERIASRIGRPVKVDRATMVGDRVKFGRVCVEIDLNKPLLSMYKIEGKTYYVTFEGLHNICTECGKYGHSDKSCPLLRKEQPVQTQSEPGSDATGKKEAVYGEWMMVKPRNEKRKAPQGREAANTEKTNASTGKGEGGSRFSVLDQQETPLAMDSDRVSNTEAQEPHHHTSGDAPERRSVDNHDKDKGRDGVTPPDTQTVARSTISPTTTVAEQTLHHPVPSKTSAQKVMPVTTQGTPNGSGMMSGDKTVSRQELVDVPVVQADGTRAARPPIVPDKPKQPKDPGKRGKGSGKQEHNKTNAGKGSKSEAGKGKTTGITIPMGPENHQPSPVDARTRVVLMRGDKLPNNLAH